MSEAILLIEVHELVADVYADKKPFQNGVNAEALVTATPVLMLKDSREKIAKLVSKSLTKSVPTMKE